MIQKMFPDRGGCSLLGDMIETYRYLVEEKGIFRACLWFWVQCVKALPHFMVDESVWRINMFRNYLLITLRNLKKNSTFSLLNILGLAVGMAVFILIALYVQYELSFDKYHDKADRIYRVIREGRAFTPAPLGPELREKIAEVESVTRMISSNNVLVLDEQNNFLEDKFYWAGPETFTIFSIPFISGNPETALNDPDSIVLSQTMAEKYFGEKDPMGKTLTILERYPFKVSGIFKDMPGNSHFVMNFVVPYTTYFQITGNDINGWSSNYSYTYFLLQEGASPQEMESKIAPRIEYPLMKAAGAKEPYPQYFFIQPMKDIHLHSHLMQEIQANNDMKYIILFSSVAFLILLIACVNYMNLATARSLRRSKEVGLRKVVGAQKRQLIVQFLGESVTMSALAVLFSIILVVISLPVFNNLVQRTLSLNPVQNPYLFIGIMVLELFVGLLAGSYPAIKMSGFKPVTVLRGVFTRSSRGSSLRNVLVLVQFSITIILIVCALGVRKQLNFIKNRDMGYDKDQIITLAVRGESVRQNINTIKTELLQNADIIAVSTSDRLPNNIDTFTSRDWTGRQLDEPIPIFYNSVDYEFVDLFGMEMSKES